jgi:hypothetical protein
VSHNCHQSLALSGSFVALRNNFDTLAHIADELLDVLDLLGGVAQQEVSVSIDPELDSLLELLDQGN